MRTLHRGLAGLLLLAAPARAAANNIITAEHPPIARGWTLQFDDRVTYARGDSFVARDGSESRRSTTQRLDLLIVRLFVPGWMFRASLPYASQSVDGSGRYGAGDAIFQAGASLDPGDWRFRLLAYAKAPTGSYAASQAVNIGSGQWDVGPDVYVTRYLDDKRVDLDLQAQYVFKFKNGRSGVLPGDEFVYAVTAARRFEAGKVPFRVGVEHRGFFGEPNSRGGAAIAPARRSLGVGPVALFDLGKFAKGWQLWPTVIFDVYDRNLPRTTLYYLKILYNWY